MDPPAGVRAEIVRRGTGQVVETAQTRIAESSLRALRAVAEAAPILFTVSPAGDGFLVEIPRRGAPRLLPN